MGSGRAAAFDGMQKIKVARKINQFLIADLQ